MLSISTDMTMPSVVRMATVEAEKARSMTRFNDIAGADMARDATEARRQAERAQG